MKLTKENKAKRKENIRNYILFRNKLEDELDEVKNTTKNNIKSYKLKLKDLDISVQKVDKHITMFKNEISEKNIKLTSEKIFKYLVESFEYISSAENYKKCEEQIKEYISDYLNSILELKLYRSYIRNEMKEYRNRNKGQFNFNSAEHAFVEMRRNLKNYTEDDYLDDLKLSREVADEIMQEIISNPTKIAQVKIEKPKKPKKYKMTEMEVLQMIFGNKDMLESIKKL